MSASGSNVNPKLNIKPQLRHDTPPKNPAAGVSAPLPSPRSTPPKDHFDDEKHDIHQPIRVHANVRHQMRQAEDGYQYVKAKLKSSAQPPMTGSSSAVINSGVLVNSGTGYSRGSSTQKPKAVDSPSDIKIADAAASSQVANNATDARRSPGSHVGNSTDKSTTEIEDGAEVVRDFLAERGVERVFGVVPDTSSSESCGS